MISALRSLCHDREENLLFFIWALRSIRHDHRKKTFLFHHYFDYATIMKKMSFFLFYWDVRYGNIFLHDITCTYCIHYVTNLSRKFPNNILPVKNMCNLKNFLQWSLTYLLPKFWLLCHLINCTCTYFENRKLPWDKKGERK